MNKPKITFGAIKLNVPKPAVSVAAENKEEDVASSGKSKNTKFLAIFKTFLIFL